MASRESLIESIFSDLKKQIYRPLYLLFGEEPYFIDVIAEFIEKNVLTDEEKEFNLSIIYGKDIDAATLISYARRYPMMANYQVLIVREAQVMEDLDELLP